MKTPLIYGLLMAVIGALITFGLYFAGYHESAEKLPTAQWIGACVGIVAGIVCMSLAMRERRAEFPMDRTWGYGSALATGVLTGLVAVVLGAVLAYVYFGIVNPQFSDVVYQAQVAKMEQKGMNSSQIEAASGLMRRFMSPVAMTVMQAVSGMVWSVIMALIIAIFFRKRNVPAETVEATMPPAM